MDLFKATVVAPLIRVPKASALVAVIKVENGYGFMWPSQRTINRDLEKGRVVEVIRADQRGWYRFPTKTDHPQRKLFQEA